VEVDVGGNLDAGQQWSPVRIIFSHTWSCICVCLCVMCVLNARSFYPLPALYARMCDILHCLAEEHLPPRKHTHPPSHKPHITAHTLCLCIMCTPDKFISVTRVISDAHTHTITYAF